MVSKYRANSIYSLLQLSSLSNETVIFILSHQHLPSHFFRFSPPLNYLHHPPHQHLNKNCRLRYLNCYHLYRFDRFHKGMTGNRCYCWHPLFQIHQHSTVLWRVHSQGFSLLLFCFHLIFSFILIPFIRFLLLERPVLWLLPILSLF